MAADAPATGRGIIAAVGDSLTYGAGVPTDDSYPAILSQRLQQDGYAFKIVNEGVRGETSSGTLFRIQQVISSLNPDIIILCTGANDGMRGINPDVLRMNLDRTLSMIERHHIQVILVGVKSFFPTHPEYAKKFDGIYPEIARKHGVLFVPFLLEGVAGDPTRMQSDGIHPNADGYRKVVDQLYPHVRQTIENGVK